MQIHRIHGRDLRDALERAARLHGTNAVVLGHEQVAGGVTVAVTDSKPRSGSAARSGGASRAGSASPPGAAERRRRGEHPRSPRPVVVPEVVSEPAAAVRQAPKAKPAEPRVAPASAPARGPAPARAPGLADVERALLRTGTSPGLTASVLGEIERGTARGPFALDRAAQLLGEHIAIAPSPKVSRGSGAPLVLAFVGPRGAGVTTTVTKLASRLVKKRRRIAMVDLAGDNLPLGSLRRSSRELDRYGRLLQVPVDAVRRAQDLREVLSRSRGFDTVILDGTGLPGSDVALLRELQTLVPDLRLETYLTLPANAYRGELDAIAADYAAIDVSGVVLTHLDATDTPAPALEHALDTGHPLAFLCDGPQVAKHFHRPSAELVANLFLRGRLG